jgi:RNA polymerase sigma factor (sigma-70 family)
MERADEETYVKYAPELLRFAAGLAGPSKADDLLSSAFLKATSAPTWAAVTDRRAYLYRTVLNEARQVRRGDRRRLEREFVAARSEVVSSHDDAIELTIALARLSTLERAVIYLTYWLGATVVESATTLSMSPRAVERQLFSARRSLRKALDDGR